MRKVWLDASLLFLGDTGFYTPRLIILCESMMIDYVVGYRVNSILKKHERIIELQNAVLEAFEATEEPQKWFTEIDDYKARTWLHARRVVAKAEVSTQGENLRFVLTSLDDEMESLYSDIYCSRGDMENRIKGQKCFFSDLNSCMDWWPNQFRIILSGLVYTLLERLRAIGLKDTVGECWQVYLLKENLLKISAIVTRNTRRIKFIAAFTTFGEQ